MIENCGENCSKEEAIKAGFLKSDREFLDQVDLGIIFCRNE